MSDILVVDDNEIILSLIAEVAHINGYDIRTVNNATDFFSAYGEKRPDMVMIDIVMPEMDGLETMQRLAKLDPKVPVVAMSGYDYIDSQGAKLLTKGLNLVSFLKKPFDVAELIELFPKVLKQPVH